MLSSGDFLNLGTSWKDYKMIQIRNPWGRGWSETVFIFGKSNFVDGIVRKEIGRNHVIGMIGIWHMELFVSFWRLEYIYIYHAGWNDANHQIDVANLQNFVDQMIKLMYHQSSEYWKKPSSKLHMAVPQNMTHIDQSFVGESCLNPPTLQQAVTQWPKPLLLCCYTDYIGAYTNQYHPICIYILYIYIHPLVNSHITMERSTIL